jgi:hypothetical protein
VVAERRLVACALHGPPQLANDARGVLELFPPTTLSLQRLLRGDVPTLHTGLHEQRLVSLEWPVSDTIAELSRRMWTAQARRELMRAATGGDDATVRRCWAALHYATEEGS